MTHKEVMQQALETLEQLVIGTKYEEAVATEKTITALRKALEQPEQDQTAEAIHAAWSAGYVEGEKAALEQPEQEPIGWLDGDETLAEFMHRDLKAAHDRCGSATPREFTIPVYLAPPAAQPENGDIRALKYRIHELEGEVLGYKRMLEEAALKKLADLGQEIEQEPVACLSKNQAKAILDLALDLEKTGRLVSLTEGQERSNFVTRNRAIQCALEDALRNATTPPAAQRKPLTDEQVCEMYNEPRSDAEMLEFARAIEAAHGIKEGT